MSQPNTVFLRLEGLLQSWGDTSKFVVRRTMEAPTKSGVLGLICCAMGLSREAARPKLPELNKLVMGVRMDRPGTRWWDYQTVGAGIGLMTAAGGIKTDAQGTLVTRREYLTDASFLVVLHGEPTLIENVAKALQIPKWPIYLGRKSCPPSIPIFAGSAEFPKLEAALSSPKWRPRLEALDGEKPQNDPTCLLEWRSSELQRIAPNEAEVWYDVPVSFNPPVHGPRLVIRKTIVADPGESTQQATPPPPRPRANYNKTEWTSEKLVEVVDPKTGEKTMEPFGARPRRLRRDHGLCVFCKSPATTVQHVTYRRAGGSEEQEDLRALCRLCHDAVTMIEYGLGMGLDRINPEEPRWRDAIIEKRREIVSFRSLATRKRKLQPEEIE